MRHGINFHGLTADELEREFQDAVDSYLAAMEEDGKEPEKQFSGKILLRMDPELHADLNFEAAKKDVSLNEYLGSILSARRRA